MKKRILSLALLSLEILSASAQRYVGGDISLLPEYENAGAQYKTEEGSVIEDLLPWLHSEGMNAMRVRLFVNPDDHKTKFPSKFDPNACQDLEYITPLCKRIVDDGFNLMLDFHYSDTWADPAKQWTPESWKDLSDEQLYEKIYDYTKATLLSLKEAGISPAFIQPGNEISYGMLWGPENASSSSLKKVYMGNSANWDRFGKLLNHAIKACKEVCPDAKIVLHTERVAQVDVLTNFYDQMKKLDVDYDIIGLSYYPYFHGDMGVLDKALSTLQTRYPEKNIMIVETGYSYKWEVPGTTHDFSGKWAYSEEGQDKFAKELVATLEKYGNVNGLFWWWMEYNAYNTNLGGWYNAPLFNSLDGRATPALKTICSFGENSAVDMIGFEMNEDDIFYDLQGRRITDPCAPGIKISRSKKTLTK
ncbi:MAG: arabinogalactan endo-1,4-beta-galactosidase [Muribaculaceae bacterium]|nr:arabinogalactan endo-1,4-beta-galactosidase [Muribaculaceae bacterium]